MSEAEAVLPARGVPWLTESSPQAWDFVARRGYRGDELTACLAACDWSRLELDRSSLPNDMCPRAWREP